MSTYLDHNAGSPLRPEAKAAIARLLEGEGATPRRSIALGSRRAGARGCPRAGRGAYRRRSAAGDLHQRWHRVQQPRDFRLAQGASLPTHNRQLLDRAFLDSRAAGRFGIARCQGRTRVAPDREGRLPPDEVAAVDRFRYCAGYFALANSEVGTIQEVRAIADAASKARRDFSSRCRAGHRSHPRQRCRTALRSDDAQRPQARRACRNRRAIRSRAIRTDADTPRRSAGEWTSRRYAESPGRDRFWRRRGSRRGAFS